jgi:hypothetical protein
VCSCIALLVAPFLFASSGLLPTQPASSPNSPGLERPLAGCCCSDKYIPTPPGERNKILRGASTLPIDSTFLPVFHRVLFWLSRTHNTFVRFFAIVPQKASFLAFPLLVFLDPFSIFSPTETTTASSPRPTKKLAKLACVCVPRSSVSSFCRWWCDRAGRRDCVVFSAAAVPLLGSILRRGVLPFSYFVLR